MNLKEELLRGIYAYGFEKPSAIQQRAIVPCIKGLDVIAQAQSGTGKTATFSIAILEKIALELLPLELQKQAEAMDQPVVEVPHAVYGVSRAGMSFATRFRAWLLMKAIAPLLFIMVVTLGTAVTKAARLGWSRKSLLKALWI